MPLTVLTCTTSIKYLNHFLLTESLRNSLRTNHQNSDEFITFCRPVDQPKWTERCMKAQWLKSKPTVWKQHPSAIAMRTRISSWETTCRPTFTVAHQQDLEVEINRTLAFLSVVANILPCALP